MFLTPAELYRVLDATGESTLDQRFIELYESDGRNRFNRTVRDMLSSRVITPWKPLYANRPRPIVAGTSP